MLMKSPFFLAVVVPFALCVAGFDRPLDAMLAFEVMVNLPFIALPQLVSWWFAAKVDASDSPAFLGGLIAANIVLAFFLFGFGRHGAELLWYFYWPLCIGATWVGHFVGERVSASN